ncbi:hypothetical protein BHE74_00014486, partial [Ensete ventricosum]
VKAVAEELGLGFLGIGFQPKWRLNDIPVMPKVPMTGLKTPFRGGLLRHVAEDVLKLAKVTSLFSSTGCMEMHSL